MERPRLAFAAVSWRCSEQRGQESPLPDRWAMLAHWRAVGFPLVRLAEQVELGERVRGHCRYGTGLEGGIVEVGSMPVPRHSGVFPHRGQSSSTGTDSDLSDTSSGMESQLSVRACSTTGTTHPLSYRAITQRSIDSTTIAAQPRPGCRRPRDADAPLPGGHVRATSQRKPASRAIADTSISTPSRRVPVDTAASPTR